MEPAKAVYSDEQANEILRTALRLAAPDEITFEELVCAAAELGIPRSDLHEAEERFRQNSSEAGLRREFAQMQRLELRAFGLHTAIYALVAGLIIGFELEKQRLYLIPVVVGAWLALILWKKRDLKKPSPKHEQQYENWIRRKHVWLRPERAAEIVRDELLRPLGAIDRIDGGSPRSMMGRRLRQRLGYDRKRAKAVVKAFLVENPGIEEQYRYDPVWRYPA
jgi:hypothetical protein